MPGCSTSCASCHPSAQRRATSPSPHAEQQLLLLCKRPGVEQLLLLCEGQPDWQEHAVRGWSRRARLAATLCSGCSELVQRHVQQRRRSSTGICSGWLVLFVGMDRVCFVLCVGLPWPEGVCCLLTACVAAGVASVDWYVAGVIWLKWQQCLLHFLAVQPVQHCSSMGVMQCPCRTWLSRVVPLHLLAQQLQQASRVGAALWCCWAIFVRLAGYSCWLRHELRRFDDPVCQADHVMCHSCDGHDQGTFKGSTVVVHFWCMPVHKWFVSYISRQHSSSSWTCNRVARPASACSYMAVEPLPNRGGAQGSMLLTAKL